MNLLPYFNKVIAGPAVFDCGSNYAVIWATSAKGSGCVRFTVNGKEKTVWDAGSGSIKTHDTVHSVKISKSEFDGCEYKVISQRVDFKFGYSAIKGKTVESPLYKFKKLEKEDNISILCISDIHDREAEMKKALQHIGTNHDLIVLLGDISSELEYKKRFIDRIIRVAGEISGGTTPVIYTRGNHETRGEFASQLINYFPTDTGEFWFKINFGPLSGLVLDSGEDKDDGHIEYSGLVDFKSYREREYKMLCGLNAEDFKGRYKIAFCHFPVLSNHFGTDWSAPLKKCGMQLLCGGHTHTVEFIDGELPSFIEGGKCNKAKYFAVSSIILKDGKMHLKTVTDSGECVLERTI